MNFKKNPVVIVKDDMNNTIRVSKNNAEYAHIRLQQERTMINSNGWLNTTVVSTLIHGKTEALIASGIKRMKKLPGNIVVQESLEGKDRDLKYAGKTGIVCCIDGQPIYRVTKYDATGTLEDTLIAHNNGDAIRQANAENAATLEDLAAAAVVTENEDESEETVDENQVDLEDAIAEVEAEALETTTDPDEDEHDELTVEDTVETEVDEEVEVQENVFTL